MDAFDKFYSYLVKEVRAIIEPIKEQHMEELGQTILNELCDLEGKRVVDRELSQRELFFREIFYRFIEINNSYIALKDIEVYIGRFPYSKENISKVRNLLYNISNYMNEMYILKERLSTYLTKIGRLYRKDRRHEKILKSTRGIFKMVANTFSGITRTRGAHVHQLRYTDKEIDRLNLIELLVQNGSLDFFEQSTDFYEFEYRNIRKKWKNIVKQNNEALRELFNIYFDALLKILFDKNGNLIYPQAISHI
jgi:hypothetical protein